MRNGPAPESRSSGSRRHSLSVIDRLGDVMGHGLTGEHPGRDPAFILRMMPFLDVALAYFDAEIRGFDRLPEHGPMLIVANHSGGIYMPDYWAFFRHWVRVRGIDEPLVPLGFDFLFGIPGLGDAVRRLGTVPASPTNAARLLQAGHSVMVFPGGDADDYRPWTERHRVDLHGHSGFIRVALREQVPVIPVVSHGSHDAIFVVARGEALARWLGLERLRINVLPLVAGLPWGVAPAPLPTWPLPAKVTVQVCEPFDWTHIDRDQAEDPAVVQHCYEETLGRMQSSLDQLVAESPHPVLTRLRHPATHGSAVAGTAVAGTAVAATRPEVAPRVREQAARP